MKGLTTFLTIGGIDIFNNGFDYAAGYARGIAEGIGLGIGVGAILVTVSVVTYAVGAFKKKKEN